MNLDELSVLLAVVRRPRPVPGTAEERLQLLSDEREVTDLVLRYGWLCDARRWDEIWDLYTDDFEREVLGAPEENVKGISEVRAMYLPLLEADAASLASGAIVDYEMRHMVSPPFVRVGPENNTAVAIVAYDLVTRHGQPSGARGQLRQVSYVWQLRSTSGLGWRFSRLLVISQDARDANARVREDVNPSATSA